MMETKELQVNRLDSLYARDSAGRIKVWNCWVAEENDGVAIIFSHGLLGGNLTGDRELITKGTNLGKSNATTPLQQATNEALARWKKKKKQGYKSLADLGFIGQSTTPDVDFLIKLLDQELPKDNTDINGNLKPMKCQQYLNKSGKPVIKFPCFGQPKYNGFRCMAKLVEKVEGLFSAKEVQFLSKDGETYTVNHVANQFKADWFNLQISASFNDIFNQELTFDGEMYIHGELLQDISSAVRKPNDMSPRLEYIIFDVAIPDAPQKRRLEILEYLEAVLTRNNVTHIKVAPYRIIKDDSQAQRYCDYCIADGYEGAVFRDVKAEYGFGKRPSTIVKLKRFKDSEFTITGVSYEPGKENYAVLICKNDINDATFEVTPEGDLTFRAGLVKDKEKLIGKTVTVKYYERTKEGKPFHATAVFIHDYNK